MEQRHEGAAAGEPDRRLGGRVAAADDADPLRAAELGLGRPGGVEDAHALVLVEAFDREPPVVGAGREDDRVGDHLVVALEPDRVPGLTRLERERAIGRRSTGVELARLGDRAAGQLVAADPGREAEVVLDPPRGARLAAEPEALDHERLEALGGAVHGGPEPRRPAADDRQVDALAVAELEPDPERARELADWSARTARCPPGRRTSGRRSASTSSIGEATSGSLGRVDEAVGDPRALHPLDRSPRRLRSHRADDLDPDPVAALERLAAADEGREQDVGERAVLGEEPAEDLTIDGDVAHRLRRHRGQEDRLAGEQVHLAEEPGRTVADDLVAGGVLDRSLALEDRDERVGRVADAVQPLPGLRGPLLAVLGEDARAGLRRGSRRRGCSPASSVPGVRRPLLEPGEQLRRRAPAADRHVLVLGRSDDLRHPAARGLRREPENSRTPLPAMLVAAVVGLETARSPSPRSAASGRPMTSHPARRAEPAHRPCRRSPTVDHEPGRSRPCDDDDRDPA